MAGASLITRDFAPVSGFAMVVHEEIEAHTFLFGQTVVKIDYDGYDIERERLVGVSARTLDRRTAAHRASCAIWSTTTRNTDPSEIYRRLDEKATLDFEHSQRIGVGEQITSQNGRLQSL